VGGLNNGEKEKIYNLYKGVNSIKREKGGSKVRGIITGREEEIDQENKGNVA